IFIQYAKKLVRCRRHIAIFIGTFAVLGVLTISPLWAPSPALLGLVDIYKSAIDRTIGPFLVPIAQFFVWVARRVGWPSLGLEPHWKYLAAPYVLYCFRDLGLYLKRLFSERRGIPFVVALLAALIGLAPTTLAGTDAISTDSVMVALLPMLG